MEGKREEEEGRGERGREGDRERVREMLMDRGIEGYRGIGLEEERERGKE